MGQTSRPSFSRVEKNRRSCNGRVEKKSNPAIEKLKLQIHYRFSKMTFKPKKRTEAPHKKENQAAKNETEHPQP